ncbi:MAG: ATP-dependent helicase [Jatrophihabitans sp.]|uniref:ATP-dependent helicase n=1 Tax=Jatrophihabitans sp. TaxID=1932789 RepID=UPI003F821EEA
MTSARSYHLLRTAPPPATAPVLDAQQRRVVDHPGGPLLVLAGPGTGKTTTLVETVVDRVQRGVPVESILMLTFSRRAAVEMRDRVAARLDRTVREPIARTLHSYAFGILRMAAVRDGAPAPRLLASAEQDVLIRDLLADGDVERWPVGLRPALRTLGFADELRDFLMRAVERGLDGPTLQHLGRVYDRPDWLAAGAFLTEYQGVTVLRDPGGYDPAELISGALNALHADPSLLAAERERRRHLFVDEYQDTDPAQAELVQLLADGADELVLVGDPDQSIYAFRGADESAIRDVSHRFGGGGEVPVVALRECRRFGADLVEATRRIAHRLPGRAEQRAVTPAAGLDPGRVDVHVFRSASEEAAYLAGVLRRAHLEGIPWQRMAVLVRSTAQTLGVLRRAMTTAGVPVAVRAADIPLAEQPAVDLLLDLLGCAADPGRLDEAQAEALLTGPLGGADSLTLRRVRRVLRRTFPDDGGALVPVLLDPSAAALLPPAGAGAITRVARTLAAGRAAVESGGDVEAVLWAVWTASGLAGRWETASLAGGPAGAAADRDLDAVLRLFDEAANFVDRLPGEAPARFADHLRAQQIPGDAMALPRREADAVAILTAHAGKGLEWDVVAVAHVQEGGWPDLRRRGSLLGTDELLDAIEGRAGTAAPASVSRQLAEERRLFYVAATRARRHLVVTAVTGEDEQPSRFLDELDPRDEPRSPTRPMSGVHLPGLVAELRAVVTAPDAPEGERRAAASQLARLAHAGVPGADPDEWWGLAPLSTTAGVADPDRPVPISPSRVEPFLDCELRTVLQQLGGQDDQGTAAGLGTLVHALAAAEADPLDLAELERQLDEQWSTLDFGAAWYAKNQRETASGMLDRLVTWLRESRATLERVDVERGFRAEVGDAVIAGRVDRLERDADGRLVVIDLKTGRNKPSDATAHPQLGVYQLAIEAGGFGDGEVAGGARLVQLGTGGAIEQVQRPLAEHDDPEWARRTVEHVAERMRGHEFLAIDNSRCHVCEVRSCCPLQPVGRQVPQ